MRLRYRTSRIDCNERSMDASVSRTRRSTAYIPPCPSEPTLLAAGGAVINVCKGIPYTMVVDDVFAEVVSVDDLPLLIFATLDVSIRIGDIGKLFPMVTVLNPEDVAPKRLRSLSAIDGIGCASENDIEGRLVSPLDIGVAAPVCCGEKNCPG